MILLLYHQIDRHRPLNVCAIEHFYVDAGKPHQHKNVRTTLINSSTSRYFCCGTHPTFRAGESHTPAVVYPRIPWIIAYPHFHGKTFMHFRDSTSPHFRGRVFLRLHTVASPGFNDMTVLYLPGVTCQHSCGTVILYFRGDIPAQFRGRTSPHFCGRAPLHIGDRKFSHFRGRTFPPFLDSSSKQYCYHVVPYLLGLTG